ncbi:MAG: aminomethyltransferase family protein, partial [Acidimicrobiales bacterium]
MTGFHKSAEAAGARFVEYEGYWLPTAFGDDIMEEYRACRERVIVIDLSPLRKFEVTGPGALALLQATVTRDLSKLRDGQVVYTAMCNDDGGLVDDGTVFRFDDQRFRWIGYTDDDGPWLQQHADRLGLDAHVEPSTHRVHNAAVQGPASREALRGLLPAVDDLTWFRFAETRLGESGPPVVLSRTGYSGELGYEIFCHPDDGAAVWEAVWSAGRSHGIGGLGLEALDPLRIEAGLLFKGYEYDAGV